MSVEENIHYTFISQAQPEDTFTVVEFKGTEGISKLYQFEIIIYADDPDIDLKKVLKSPVKLTVKREGETQRMFHGILSRLEQLHEISGHVYYRAILVPRLWLADQYHENQLFLEKKFPDILEDILKQTGLTSNDYELKLTGNYQPWEYVCQYNETDFNFISRWMEREGIYYYFEQGDQGEKLIITDSSTAHQDIPSGKSVRYSPPDSLTPTTTEQIREFTCHQQMLPKKVILKDYNYRKPSLDLKGEADVDSEGRGNVYIYGEHFKTPEEGNALAKIRAEELICREAVFYGEGTVPPFLTGYIFEMHDHYRDSYNQRYLITELRHQGVQSTYLTGAGGDTSGKEKPAYLNNFTAIKAEIQFRPQRLAEKPKIDGSINAKIDAAGDGQYAEIDDEGRYKVILPFDQSGNKDGKASRWIRMSQPYAGADYGMHFPLHKGTEVLLTFVDGDPDRPIISGTVPNPETGSPVKGGNQTQCMIRTGGGNQIKFEDNDGAQLIKLSSPTEGTFMRIGAPNPGNPAGIDIGTGGQLYTTVGGHVVEKVGDNYTTTINGAKYQVVDGDVKYEFHSNSHKIVAGNQLTETSGSCTQLIGGYNTTKIDGMNYQSVLGLNTSLDMAGHIEEVLGVKYSGVKGALIDQVTGVICDFSMAGKIDKAPQMSAWAGKQIEKVGMAIQDVGSLKWNAGEMKIKASKEWRAVDDWSAQFNKSQERGGKMKKTFGSIIMKGGGAVLKIAGSFNWDNGTIKAK
jgi:type VI secretion system secreted protein VgrG